MTLADIWNEFLAELVMFVGTLLIVLIGALIGYLISLIRAKIQDVQNETMRKAVTFALDEAQRVRLDAIRATNEAYVDAIKKGREDGHLEPEEVKEAARIAAEYWLRHMSQGSKDILIAFLGPINEWLDGFIQSGVPQVKQEKAVLQALLQQVNATSAPKS